MLLAWTCDDDLYQPGAIEALARELTLDPAVGMVFADYELVDEQGARRAVQTGPIEELPQRNVVGLCFMFRRAAFEQAGALDPQFWLAEDYEYWVRMSRVTRMQRLRRVLYEIHEHPGTLTASKAAQVQEVTIRVQQHHYGEPRDEQARRGQLVRLAGAYKAQGLAWKSLGAAWKLIRAHPAGGAGWWAALRAVTPGPLLRLTRRARGLPTERT